MHELALLLANAMPREKLIDDLFQAIQDYKLLGESEDRMNKIDMNCLLLFLKKGTEGKDVMSVIKDFNKLKDANAMFNKIATS